ncbi:MAG: family 16 glycosylhydrolase [Chloroflexi bacterium]|nr:family 16 glycosylhydrolase [Chloroflexota bacterium]
MKSRPKGNLVFMALVSLILVIVPAIPAARGAEAAPAPASIPASTGSLIPAPLPTAFTKPQDATLTPSPSPSLTPSPTASPVPTATPTPSIGEVWAWGYNNSGQLGNGTITDSLIRVQVTGLSGVTAIAGGDYHSLALKSDGTVRAWGQNYLGQLGNGANANSSTPVQVSSLTGVTGIAGGTSHSLALKSDGSVWAWGRGDYGQLGNGTTTNRLTPIQVSNVTGVTAIAGGGHHSLALKSDGSVWAWGENYLGQLGDGTTTDRSTPVQVTGLSGVTGIAGGTSHSLAMKSDGSVWAWGRGDYGQLGNGGNANSSTPVQVSGLSGVTAMAGGDNHSLAMKSDGTVWAWGLNSSGQLGNGTTTRSSTPVQVTGLTGMTAIAGGGNHSLAVKSDGTVRAWGQNYLGQLGNGTTTESHIPVQVYGLSGMTAVAGGVYHSLSLKSFTPPPGPVDLSVTTTISSQTTIVGATIAVGNGTVPWAPDEAVTAYLASTNGQRDWTTPSIAGSAVATTVADGLGNWSASFIMPDRAGSQGLITQGVEIYVVGGTNGALFSTRAAGARTAFPNTGPVWGAGGTGTAKAMVVTPFVTINPSRGLPGTTITMKGSGFAANEKDLEVNFGDGGALNASNPGPFSGVLASGIWATSSGSWIATVSSPSWAAPGRYNLVVIGITGAPAYQAFEILRAPLNFTPTSAPPGTLVAFWASDYTPGHLISVTLNGQVLETIPAVVQVSETGRVGGLMRIPPQGILEGPAQLIFWYGPASAPGIATGSATFVVTAPPTPVPTPALQTATPTPTPTPGVSPSAMPLQIVSVSSPVNQGDEATLAAKTSPGAQCTITVYYSSGASGASGLSPKAADSAGNVSWTWRVGNQIMPGTWRIVVTASLDGQTVSQTTYFVVTETPSPTVTLPPPTNAPSPSPSPALSPSPAPTPTPTRTPSPTPSPSPTASPSSTPSPTPMPPPDKYDEFSTSPTGYNSALWQAESAGAGTRGWDGISVLGQSSPGEGFAGLSSKSNFQYGTAEFRARSTDGYGAVNQFGWTDATPASSPPPYRYNLNAGGNNGVWLHDSTGGFYPSLLTFAAKSNGNLTQKTITLDPPNDSKQSFHTYKIAWQAGAAELYIDGFKKATITTNVPSVSLPFRMVSEAWQGSSGGGWMYADYVKIWSAAIIEPTPTATPTPSPTASPTVPPSPTATPVGSPAPSPAPAPTATPTPSPTPAPTTPPPPPPTPTPTPPAGTYVQAVSRDVSVAGTVQIPVIVKNVTASAGLGGYDVTIGYDTAVIRALELLGGPEPFNSTAASNINNTAGQAVFNGYQVQNPGPKGDIIVAYLSVSAQGTVGASTPLTVTVNSLVDANGAPIPATPVNGTTRIVSTQSVVTLVPVVGSDGIARLDVRISRIINPSTGADVPAARGIGAFDGTVSFDKSGISVLEVTGYGAFAGSLTTNIRNDTGKAMFNGIQVSANPQPPVTLVQVTPRLSGSSATSYGLQVSFSTISDVLGAEMPQDAARSLSLLRGDARADGVVNIADAMFIAQYRVGIRGLGTGDNDVNSINAASPRHHEGGDKIDMTDALFIAQMRVGLRDAFYN